MKPEKIEEKIELPKGIEVTLKENEISLRSNNGELKKSLFSHKVKLTVEGSIITLSANKPSKREKKIIGTFKAHLKNMIKGLTKGHVYRLKICASHFPMSVSANNREFIIKNFFGESIPRKLKIEEGVDIKIEGDIIIVSSINKEHAGQTSASIENLTRRHGFDRRVYMDGIYIFDKDGKTVS